MSERKILYSPGYGAGWISWNTGVTPEQRLFMLTYQPFIDKIEQTGEPGITGELVDQFYADWRVRWPDADYPFCGGLSQLEVYYADGLVCIDDYDGNERVKEAYDDWI